MKIIKSGFRNVGFTYVIEFDFDYINSTVEDIEIEVNNICEWVSNTFAENFVVLEHCHTRIAGGNVDNKSAWSKYGIDRDIEYNPSSIDYYELRCCESDAMLFMLKFKR
jgi:hypothetical protein